MILKINSLNNLGIKPGLERIRKILALIGNPQKKLKFIHVAGTNGKGSVCFMLASILKESSYKVGLYISPSIEDFRERIQINGEFIPKNDVCRLFHYFEEFFKEFSSDKLSEFELTTAMAFKYFEEKDCDVVILETGMGGKYDATNIIENSLCSIVTGVSYDHTNFLGENILDIASEKLGIIKPRSKLVIAEDQDEKIYDLAKKLCTKNNTTLFIAHSNNIHNFKNVDFKGSEFEFQNKKLKVNLLGKHQKRNVAIVLETLNVTKNDLKISFNSLKNGLKKVKIPCRLEVLNLYPLVILDAAHNVESITALTNFIKNSLCGRNVFAICSMFSDKDIQGSFKIIGKYLTKIFLIKSDSPRATNINKLENILLPYCKNIETFKDFDDTFKHKIINISKNDALIVFGSFSIMKKTKKFLNSLF